MFDAVVRRGSIVSAQETRPGDIAIKDGKIVAVLAPGTPVVAEHEYDATGCYVLPGAVDVHVHSRAPARPDRETWESATQAAARGGITTIVEMPTSDPAASTPAVLRNRVRTALQSAHVDFACTPAESREVRVPPPSWRLRALSASRSFPTRRHPTGNASSWGCAPSPTPSCTSLSRRSPAPACRVPCTPRMSRCWSRAWSARVPAARGIRWSMPVRGRPTSRRSRSPRC